MSKYSLSDSLEGQEIETTCPLCNATNYVRYNNLSRCTSFHVPVIYECHSCYQRNKITVSVLIEKASNEEAEILGAT